MQATIQELKIDRFLLTQYNTGVHWCLTCFVLNGIHPSPLHNELPPSPSFPVQMMEVNCKKLTNLPSQDIYSILARNKNHTNLYGYWWLKMHPSPRYILPTFKEPTYSDGETIFCDFWTLNQYQLLGTNNDYLKVTFLPFVKCWGPVSITIFSLLTYMILYDMSMINVRTGV